MKILFWYNRVKTNKKGVAPIMIRITIDGKRLNISTNIEIEEKYWDQNHQSIKGNSDLIDKYNQYLVYLKSKVWEAQNECLKNDTPITLDFIRNKIKGTESNSYSLLETFDYQITHLKNRVGIDISASTVKKYETCKRKVQSFLDTEKSRSDILLHELNHQFIFEFDAFMRTKEGLQNNGVVKNIQQLKTVIKIALLNDWLNKDPFVKYQGRIIESKRTFLTDEELKRLELIEIKNDKLQRVRDVYIFSCYTGLAFSDVAKLNEEHFQRINNQNWIILDRTKTKNQSTIPLLPKAVAILDKYSTLKSGNLLPIISSQNTNKYLKELAIITGINKKLSFHSARHTFASTVTLNQGVDIMTVSAMLGHRTLKSTQIYSKVNLNKIAGDTKKLF